MVIALLYGGLGNQMFIYAMGRALSLRNEVPLVLNSSSGFERDFQYKRKFVLDNFNVNFRTDNMLSLSFEGGRYIRKLSEILGRHILYPNYRVINETSRNRFFESKWLTEAFKNVIVNGYWQSELYFKDYEEQIRKDFIFKRVFPLDVIEQSNLIKNSKGMPIAVGVRLYQECTCSDMQIVPKEYYLSAMEYIAQRVSNPVFYVFTQVPEWVQENLTFSKFTIKIIPPKVGNDRAVDDMYLMTLFKYHIISNSSFYWWGAWLAKGEIVVAPRNFVNKDSVVSSWVQM